MSRSGLPCPATGVAASCRHRRGRRVDRVASAAREWVVMKWAIIGVLGFVLEIGAVIWLARSNTAQWERDHRTARAEVRAR